MSVLVLLLLSGQRIYSFLWGGRGGVGGRGGAGRGGRRPHIICQMMATKKPVERHQRKPERTHRDLQLDFLPSQMFLACRINRSKHTLTHI